MKILWITWKDRSNPRAGGAELVNEEIAKRFVREGHEVIFLVAGFAGAPATEQRDGFQIIRLGNRYSVYGRVFFYYRQHLRGWADRVIDEMNTVPFFCRFYVREKVYLFVHQLCREVWFFQMPFPLSLIGYGIEPIYLSLLRRSETITVSESTKEDLLRHGFSEERIHLIPEGLEFPPVKELAPLDKYAVPTLLSLGSLRRMKRTADQIKAFEYAKRRLPSLRLIVAGDASGAYGIKVLRLIEASPFRDSIEYLGTVDGATKRELMRRCHLILVTSVKEGWGLIVTEAASQGTPAVVYNVDGLRDSVARGRTGYLAGENTPQALAASVLHAFANKTEYAKIRNNAWLWSQEFSFEKTYAAFRNIISA